MNFLASHKPIVVASLFAAVAATSLIAAIPGIGPWWLAPAGLMALFRALRIVHFATRPSIALSAPVFFVYGLACTYPFFALLEVFLGGLLFAVFGTVVILLFCEARNRHVSDALFFGVVFALMEFFRTYLLGGTGMGNIYASLHEVALFDEAYRIIGIYGVSGLMAAISVLIESFIPFRHGNQLIPIPHRRMLRLMVMVIALGTAYLFHPVVLSRHTDFAAHVAVISHTKDTTEQAESIRGEYLQGIRSAYARSSDIVLLPSNALTFGRDGEQESFFSSIRSISPTHNSSTFVIGVTDSERPHIIQGTEHTQAFQSELFHAGRLAGQGEILMREWTAFPHRTNASIVLRMTDESNVRTEYGRAMRFADDIAHARMLGLPLVRAAKGGTSAIINGNGDVLGVSRSTELLVAYVQK